MLAYMNAWLLPAVYTLGWLLVLAQSRYHWAIARSTGRLGLLACVGGAIIAVFGSFEGNPGIDTLGLVTATLVALLGWVIICLPLKLALWPAFSP